MKLIKFRIKDFRSIEDSTWIDCGEVTNIIGVNESGKSNSLIALWKLNLARDGEINLIEDLPRNKYAEWRNNYKNIIFIETYFELDDDLCKKLSELTLHSEEEFKILYLARKYNGHYIYQFKDEKSVEKCSLLDIINEISKISNQLNKDEYSNIFVLLDKIKNTDDNGIDYSKYEELSAYKKQLVDTLNNYETIGDIFSDLLGLLDLVIEKIKIKPINKIEEVWNLLCDELPTFVYYSNYGNLDSEIFLPHVVQNLNRTDISGIAAAKARTLKVLFEFINLNPDEILQLGRDNQSLSEGEINEYAKRKAERQILLSSASAKLTDNFKRWWKQGNYLFDLQVDGNFFKIWVSDNLRPEKISLDNRSTGLQWFLSFYLTFLVETKESLKNSILLLDEAGLSLHPLAQKDLLAFFRGLSQDNQIIHTTHSPFLVDTENIDNVKLAYVDNTGHTVLSNDLRANTDPKKDKSIYAVHAALGLTVSDVLLHGCQPVIVEGASDQYYLHAIKAFLIANKKINPQKEIVFIPSGGVKGVRSLASLLSSTGELPFVILDSDESGKSFKNNLLKDVYKDEQKKIISIGEILDRDNVEIEDMIPYNCLSKGINKLFKDLDEFDFEDDIYNKNEPLIPQLEHIADEKNIVLPNGYKVELAKLAKKKISDIDDNSDYVNSWIELFNKIIC